MNYHEVLERVQNSQEIKLLKKEAQDKYKKMQAAIKTRDYADLAIRKKERELISNELSPIILNKQVVWHTGHYGNDMGHESWWPEDRRGIAIEIQDGKALIRFDDKSAEWADLDKIELDNDENENSKNKGD